MHNNLTYEAAMTRLEEIVTEMEDGKVPVDRLIEQAKEARSLIDFCEKSLKSVENGLQKVLDDEQE